MSLEFFKLLITFMTSKKKDNISHILLSVKVCLLHYWYYISSVYPHYRSGTPHDEIIGNSNQPMIVLLNDSEDPSRNHYHIMVEQELVQDTNCFKEAIFLLKATHYTFNIEYNGAIAEPLLFCRSLC